VKKLLHMFRDREDGAVTVDWVVMTAMVVGMALGVMTIFHDGPRSIGDSISSRLADVSTN
jgi:hypothetical protein